MLCFCSTNGKRIDSYAELDLTTPEQN